MKFRGYTADQGRFRGGLKSVDRITEKGSNDENRNSKLDTRLLKRIFETVMGRE